MNATAYDDEALPDGRWLPVRGILRFVATDPHARPDVEPTKPLAELIACPTCRAKVVESCRTATGGFRSPHTTRLVGRRCACGSTLAPRKSVCPTCRQETDDRARLTYARRRMEMAA